MCFDVLQFYSLPFFTRYSPSDGVHLCICHSIIFASRTQSRFPCLWGWDPDTDSAMKDLIPKIRGEMVKDKEIEKTKRWREVTAASPAKLHIRSDHIFRNAQHYEKSGCPIQHFSLHFGIAYLMQPSYSWWPMHFLESYVGQVTKTDAKLAIGVFSDVHDSKYP